MWAEFAQQDPPLAALTFREHTLALIWDTGRTGWERPAAPAQGATLSEESAPASLHLCLSPHREGRGEPRVCVGAVCWVHRAWATVSVGAVLCPCRGSRVLGRPWLGQELNTGS